MGKQQQLTIPVRVGPMSEERACFVCDAPAELTVVRNQPRPEASVCVGCALVLGRMAATYRRYYGIED
jgi:hypothetical protein